MPNYIICNIGKTSILIKITKFHVVLLGLSLLYLAFVPMDSRLQSEQTKINQCSKLDSISRIVAEIWEPRFLFEIVGSIIRTLIALDTVTRDEDFNHFARVLVDIDVT